MVSLSFRIPYENPVWTSSFSLHATYSVHLVLVGFILPSNVRWGAGIMKQLITHFSPFLCCLVTLRLEYLPQHRLLKKLHPMFFFECQRTSFKTIYTSRHTCITQNSDHWRKKFDYGVKNSFIWERLMMSKVKVIKQSLYRPWEALRVPGVSGSRILRQSTHKYGKVVSPTHRPPLPPWNILGTHFC
jgi:hypothetical protein